MAKTMKIPPSDLGKWGCWRFFAAVPEISRHLPATAMLTETSLQNFLARYDSVYVKPNVGGGGRGVAKVWKRAEGGYAFILERGAPVYCPTIAALYLQLQNRHRPGESCIVQQAIPLARVNGRPFDIRLLMMRVQGKWTYIGMLAKVAGPTSVVTNLARGKGYVIDVDTALQKSLNLSADQRAALKKEMIALGQRTTQRFDARKCYMDIGLDLAVDTNGRLWMIEENTRPAPILFAKLQNLSLYRRIMQIKATRRKTQALPTKARRIP